MKVIKYYCDRCGKEINENEYEIGETNVAVDSKRRKIYHFCLNCSGEYMNSIAKVAEEFLNDKESMQTNIRNWAERVRKENFKIQDIPAITPVRLGVIEYLKENEGSYSKL